MDEKGVKLYFGQDHEFLRPKGVIGLKIMFPEKNNESNPQSALKNICKMC